MIDSLNSLKNCVGQEIGVTDWLEITQERITQFAETTDDQQWIHTDPERAAKESHYRKTIAHGFLTVSLLSRFLSEAMQLRGGVRMSVNYGLNGVRFPAPVPVGSKIRARIAVDSVKESADFSDVTYGITVELDGGNKPCCVAEWIVRYYV